MTSIFPAPQIAYTRWRFAIVEKIVGIAGDIDLCNNIARICVEHDQLGGKAAADK